jgi:glycosyltransferase involved in cell wall biosynthesis
MRLMMPLYFRRAERVISASEFSTRGFLEHVKGSAAKLRTIHYCGNRRFRPIGDEIALRRVLEKYGLHRPFILTAIHHDTGRKNFANMARAFALARARGVKHAFVVCGRDVKRYAQELPLREMGIEEHVLFKGWVEQEDLPALYNAADLYLYPTRLEGFPIPITEALACGCPIVTSRGGVFPEAAGDAAVYVDPEDPTEIADAVCRVLGDEALRRTLRERGLARSAQFTWDRCAAQTLDLFTSLRPAVLEAGARPLGALLPGAPHPARSTAARRGPGMPEPGAPGALRAAAGGRPHRPPPPPSRPV